MTNTVVKGTWPLYLSATRVYVIDTRWIIHYIVQGKREKYHFYKHIFLLSLVLFLFLYIEDQDIARKYNQVKCIDILRRAIGLSCCSKIGT